MVGDYGGCVTKIGRDNGASQVLLDDLLRESCLQQVFRKEDVDFLSMSSLLKGIIFAITWHMLSITKRLWNNKGNDRIFVYIALDRV